MVKGRHVNKKSVFSTAFIFVSAVLLFSCSSELEHLEEFNGVTLRQTVTRISQKMYWTRDIDGSVLSSKVIGADGISKSVTASPSNVFASGTEDSYPPVYPSIDGFAVLNTSMIPDAAISVLDGFCSAIVERKGADSYMDASSIYALVIFRYDINREGKRFKSYILGEAYDTGPLLQCPVRFLENDGSFQDARIYLSPERSYRIVSLEFIGHEDAGEKNERS